MTASAVAHAPIVPPFHLPIRTEERLTRPDVPDEPVAAITASPRDVNAAVVALAMAGDEAAQRTIYQHHAERIHRLAWRMTGDAGWAEDLTQDVFVRAFARLHQFRGDARLGTWLYQIAMSVILNARRRHQSRESRERPLPEDLKADTGPQRIDPVLRDRVRDAVRRLPADLRAVVVLFDVEGYAHNEIAAMLRISSGASRMRLNRAREQLRSMLPMEDDR